MVKRKTGKCPECCPNGGAIFHLKYDYNYETNKDDVVWKCQNCNYSVEKRSYKPAAGPTKSQKYIINKLERFGGEVTWKFINNGRNIWISGKNYEGRKWFDGQSFFGTIGPKGKFELTLQRLFGDVKVESEIDLKVYMGIQ